MKCYRMVLFIMTHHYPKFITMRLSKYEELHINPPHQEQIMQETETVLKFRVVEEFILEDWPHFIGFIRIFFCIKYLITMGVSRISMLDIFFLSKYKANVNNACFGYCFLSIRFL